MNRRSAFAFAASDTCDFLALLFGAKVNEFAIRAASTRSGRAKWLHEAP